MLVNLVDVKCSEDTASSEEYKDYVTGGRTSKSCAYIYVAYRYTPKVIVNFIVICSLTELCVLVLLLTLS